MLGRDSAHYCLLFALLLPCVSGAFVKYINGVNVPNPLRIEFAGVAIVSNLTFGTVTNYIASNDTGIVDVFDSVTSELLHSVEYDESDYYNHTMIFFVQQINGTDRVQSDVFADNTVNGVGEHTQVRYGNYAIGTPILLPVR